MQPSPGSDQRSDTVPPLMLPKTAGSVGWAACWALASAPSGTNSMDSGPEGCVDPGSVTEKADDADASSTLSGEEMLTRSV